MFPEEYRLQPPKRTIKEAIIGTLPVAGVSIIYAFVRFYNMGSRPAPAFWITAIAITVFSFSSRIYRSRKKESDIIDRFLLTIDKDSISASQHLRADVNLSYLEVREITRTAGGGFMIKGGIHNAIIVIPPNIENKEQLEERLQAIIPIIEPSAAKKAGAKYRWVLSVLFLAVMVVFLVSREEWTNIITGSLLIIGLVYSFVRTQRSKLLDAVAKRRSWFVLLFLLVIALKMATYGFHYRYYPHHYRLR